LQPNSFRIAPAVRLLGIAVSGLDDTGLVQGMLFDSVELEKQSRVETVANGATLQEGHALVTADFDGNGQDQIVAGWRAGGGGLRLYKAMDAMGREFKSYDPGMPAEGEVAADIKGDGNPNQRNSRVIRFIARPFGLFQPIRRAGPLGPVG
jgi:hypothetical protein